MAARVAKPGLFTTRPTAAPSGPDKLKILGRPCRASLCGLRPRGLICAYTHAQAGPASSPDRRVRLRCAVRETPQPLGLTAPRDGRVVNKTSTPPVRAARNATATGLAGPSRRKGGQ